MGNITKFKKITKYAVRNGLNQDELAQEIGVTRHTLIRFKDETEKHHPATNKAIDRFIEKKKI